MNDEYWRRFRILEKRGQLLMMDFIRGLPENEYQILKSDLSKL